MITVSDPVLFVTFGERMDNSFQQTPLVLICFGLMTVTAMAYYQPQG
jgi:hypothetical protein